MIISSLPQRAGQRADSKGRLRDQARLDRGFTLTELLVVIMIMVILMGIGGLSMMQSGSGKGLNAGISTLESALAEARTLAMSRNTEARLYIHDDNTDMEGYRRKLITAYEDPTGTWVSPYRSVSLPANVYVDLGLDVGVTGGGLGAPITGVNYDFTRNSGTRAAYVEFNALGICTADAPAAGGMTTGSTLVITTGRQAANTILPNGEERVGVVVWRNGGMTTVNDVTQIDGTSDF